MRSTLLLALAVTLAAVSNFAQASVPVYGNQHPPSGPFCDSQCGNGPDANTCVKTNRDSSGTFTCQACANSTNELRMAQCTSNAYSQWPTGCVSLLSTTSSCGACNNNCNTIVGWGGSCNQGVCECTPGSCAYSTGKGWCDPATKTCAACPANKGHCSQTGDETGAETDCDVDFLTDTSNCGQCSNNCGSRADTCTQGKCTCGDKPACGGSTPICSAGECVACLSKGDCNAQRNALNPDSYCTDAGACATCPVGKGNCGGADDGTAASCETDLLETGTVPNCGTCGATTVTSNSALTCCAGTPKCGAFANTSEPTTGECAAAQACGTTQYCDENLQRCVSFISMNKPRENCNANAAFSTQATNLQGTNTCGSCNKTISDANVALQYNNVTDTYTKVCTQSSSLNCGALGNACSAVQRCVEGRCVCATSSGNWFSYSAFSEKDPEVPLLKLRDLPAKGCEASNPISILKTQYTQRASMYLNSFLDCVVAAKGPSSVSWNDFSNATARDAICTGDMNTCNSTFCSSLYTKTMKLKDSGMCESFTKFGDWYAKCAMSYRYSSDFKADETCREVAIDTLSQVNSATDSVVAFQEISLFVGCPEAKRVPAAGAYAIVTPISNGPNQWLHHEVTKVYLGSAANVAASLASAIAVVLACVFVA